MENNNWAWEITKGKLYRPFICQMCFKMSIFFYTNFRKFCNNMLQGLVIGLWVIGAKFKSCSGTHLVVCSWCCPLAASGSWILPGTNIWLFTKTHLPTADRIFGGILWKPHMLDHEALGLFMPSVVEYFRRASPHFSLSQASVLPGKEEF